MQSLISFPSFLFFCRFVIYPYTDILHSFPPYRKNFRIACMSASRVIPNRSTFRIAGISASQDFRANEKAPHAGRPVFYRFRVSRLLI
jgi:hypothetical protein